MKTCYIYIRVSTEDQKKKGYSPDNQIRQSKEYASMKGYHVIKIFDDSGRSGRTTEHRVELQELLKALEKEPVDAVIIYKIDRFARNITDFSRMYNDFKEKNIKLLSVNEGDLMEGNSLIPNIFASVAQWESEVNSARTKDALEQKYEEGWQPTRPPVGYRSVGGDDEKKTCEPDPYEAPVIKELFEMYATGSYSILQIQDWLVDQNIISKNGSPLGHGVIHNILRNPFYYGLIRWHGMSKIGKHVPIISKDLFDTCQYVLMKHRDFLLRRRTHDFLLRGFIVCSECGQRYTAEWHKDEKKFKSRGGKIGYYHCPKRDRNNCPAPYVELSNLEKQVEEEFKKMQFSQEFIDIVVRKAKERLEMNRKIAASRKQAIINQRVSLETRREKLEDKVMDDIIDRETYKRKHDDIQLKLRALDTQIKEIEDGCSIDMDLIEEVLAFTRNIYKTYIEAPTFLKRHYMRFFFERFEVENKLIVNAVPTPIFLVLQTNQAVILRNAQLPREDSNLEP